MASIPTWFDADYYMVSKLDQLQKADPDGNWTAETLKAAFEEAGYTGAEGIYAHYDQFSLAEGTDPSQYVNQSVYLTAKLAEMQKAEPDAGWTMDKIIAAFKDAGLTVGEHYEQFGVKEGINPSNEFDNAKYMADKLAQLQKDDPKGEWTAEKVQAAFDNEGLSPLDHYLLYGKDEGLTVKPVDDPIHPYNPGKEFALTTKVDTVAGTDADDTISGVASSLSSEGTLNAGDQIDGGEGLDTLKVDMKGNFTGFTGDGKMVNVENVELTNSGSIDRTFSAKGVDGATTYTIKGTTNTVNLSDLAAAGITVNLEGVQKDTSIAFTTKAVEGTSDALTLGLNGVGAVKSGTATDNTYVTATAAGIETLTVAATGANYVDLKGVSSAKSIVANGAGSLDVKDVAASVTSFDASAMTGALTANLAASDELTSVKGGAGDDTITVSKLAANAVLEGGAGKDTLVLDTVTGTLQPTMSGFENVKVSGGNVTLSGKNVQDFTALEVTNGAAVTLANVDASEFAVTASGTTAGSVTLSSPTKLTYNTTASAAKTAAKTADAVSTSITASEATSATINVGAYTDTTGATITLSKATEVTLNVASGLGTDGKTEVTTFAGTIDAAKAQSLVVKADGNLGASTFNAGEATSVTVNAANGSTDVVDINAAKATLVELTAGAAMNITGSELSGAESVTLTQNKGALTGGVALSKVNTLTVSGAGTDSAITVGTLGSSAQDYGITVNASGLKDGLTFGAAATKGDVNLNLSDVTGAIDGDTINAANVTVHAAKLGTTTLGDITATGDVVIDALGILGGGKLADTADDALTVGDISATGKAITVQFDGGSDVVIGPLTGKTVTVDASNYLGAILNTGTSANADAVIGDITATTATIKGSEIGANTFSITTDNLTYTGGLAADTLTIADAATTVGLKLSIDTGAGDDSVTITAATGKMTGTIANAETVSISAAAGGLDMSGLTITGNTTGTITGSTTADVLKGGDGNDTITAGGGLDMLTGGAGSDIFAIKNTAGNVNVFGKANMATITDFNAGGTLDKISLVTKGSAATSISTTVVSEADTFDAALDKAAAGNGGIDGILTKFEWHGDTYVVYDCTADSAFTESTDVVVKLTGTGIDLTSGVFSDHFTIA